MQRREFPVVWGDKTHLDTYEKDGFLYCPSQGIAPFNDLVPILDRMKSDSRPGKILENGSQIIRSQFDIHHQFPELLKKVIDKRMWDLASSILGGDPLIYQTHVNFKMPRFGLPYDWHSDYVYWRDHDGMLEPRAISIIMPLTVHDQDNGGIKLLKRSHMNFYPTDLTHDNKWSLSEVRHGPSYDRKKNGLVPEELVTSIIPEDIFEPNMKPGDFLIMDANTWHYSGENLSLKSREALFVVLVSSQTNFNPTLKNYRPNYITCRDQVPFSDFLLEGDRNE